jgi:hypothetical protein
MIEGVGVGWRRYEDSHNLMRIGQRTFEFQKVSLGTMILAHALRELPL